MLACVDPLNHGGHSVDICIPGCPPSRPKKTLTAARDADRSSGEEVISEKNSLATLTDFFFIVV